MPPGAAVMAPARQPTHRTAAMSLDALIARLEGDAPCGADLSFSAEFDTIQALRREDDPTLDQGEWRTELKTADWPGVERLCAELLTRRTKDLRVAGWWAEASTRLRGFAGLGEGLALCTALLRDLWDGVHPQADDGDQEQRIGTLRWLISRVEELAGQAAVVRIGRRTLGLVDVEMARQRAQAGAAPAGEPAGGEPLPTLEAIQRAVAAGGAAPFEALLGEARAAQAALAELEAVVDARLGRDGPAFGPARKALEDALDRLARLGRAAGLNLSRDATAGVGDQAGERSGEGSGGEQPGRAGAAGGAHGPLASRAQALQQLREVAEFFRRTEPHSPVAYLADKAARWGDMPLHAWLRTVVKDGASLSQLEEMLGIEPPPAPPEG
jgi:type VI secretion system protein ImpA